MKLSFKIIFSFILLFSLIFQLNAQIVESPSDPGEARFVYDDVNNFIKAFSQLKVNSDTVSILQKEYIDKGTPGLKIFIEKYGLSAEKLKHAIEKHSEDYRALDDKLKWLKTQEDSLYKYFEKFKYFIPDAVFPPTYFLVDQRRGIGSGSTEGQLITIEKEAHKIIDPGIKTHIVHELVHLNQLKSIGSLEKYLAIYNKEKSLLAITIREGVAEFFAELITGKYTQDEVRLYVNANEQHLWEQFRNEMFSKETGDWMWKSPKDPDQPRDVAYVLGALIVEYYYKHALDLSKVVPAILSITDYKEFIENSGYPKKFSRLDIEKK
jgi:hypothetical protein